MGKVGLSDESLLFDELACGLLIGQFLALAAKQGDKQLLGLAPGQLKAEWASAIATLKVGPMDLYQLRHGGASHDLLCRLRDPLQVKLLLRHSSDASLARYGKATRAQKEINKLPGPVVELGQHMITSLQECFYDPRRIPTKLVSAAACGGS